MPVACKPKHDYQGLLGMGWGGCRCVHSCAWGRNCAKHPMLVPALHAGMLCRPLREAGDYF